MVETLCRTLCYFIIVSGALYFGNYVANIEQRVTNLEERVEHGLVIPLPIDLTRFRFQIIDGESTR